MFSTAGFCVIDLLAAMGLIVTLSAVAIPNLLAGLDDVRTFGAVRYLSTRLQQSRMEAVARTARTSIRFEPTGESYTFAVFVDGNRNGVLARDIEGGIDVEVRERERLPDRFSGVDFGAIPGLPPVDRSSPPPGADPVRFGASDMVTFTPLGTSTPGSLYVRGRQSQYAIRVFGDTGKTRVLKFDPRKREWRPL
jgi:hypothetical protein